MRVVIAGGGTGGHLYPGIAVARELLARDGGTQVTFAGTAAGIEARVLPREGFTLDTSAVEVANLLTTCVTTGDVLLRKSALPAYTAVMRCRPGVSEEVVKAAVPLLSETVCRVAPPSLNATVPAGSPAAEVTVAVNVTASLKLDGLRLDFSPVAVEAGLTV